MDNQSPFFTSAPRQFCGVLNRILPGNFTLDAVMQFAPFLS